MNAAVEPTETHMVCKVSDLIQNSGVCALIGSTQIAIFYLPKETPSVYAISNWDPIGEANVMSRGIVGDIKGKLVVASPLYKQHFDLATGDCIEDSEKSVVCYKVSIDGDNVLITL